MEKDLKKEEIIHILREKSIMKQKVYDNTLNAFKQLKVVLQEIVKEYNKELADADKRVLLEYKDRGAFEAEIKVAGDLLIFNMHSNIFEFEKSSGIWKISYVKNDKLASYSGIISIYNFLNDSFKYNRLDDIGFLIGRIFINKDSHYFVEGKRQMGFLYNDFGNSKITKKDIRDIIESAIQYSLEFDLYVPDFENVKYVTVAQMKERINKSKIKTAKRLGFQFTNKSNEDINA
jgi:hypothetical protein